MIPIMMHVPLFMPNKVVNMDYHLNKKKIQLNCHRMQDEEKISTLRILVAYAHWNSA